MSIINKPPEMVKREYKLQEPIAVAVEKYATSSRVRRITSSIPHWGS